MSACQKWVPPLLILPPPPPPLLLRKTMSPPPRPCKACPATISPSAPIPPPSPPSISPAFRVCFGLSRFECGSWPSSQAPHILSTAAFGAQELLENPYLTYGRQSAEDDINLESLRAISVVRKGQRIKKKASRTCYSPHPRGYDSPNMSDSVRSVCSR